MLVAQGVHQHVAAGRAGLVQPAHGPPASAACTLHAAASRQRSVRRRACRKVARVCRACCSSAYAEDRRRFLLTYVQQCDDPGVIIKSFIDHAPTQVVDAMRTTISGMLGTLPPQYFDVSVNTSSESLASLMLSVLMTGYLLCNAQHRMDLARQLGPAEEGREPRGLALQTASFDSEEEVLYAPGTQTTRVSGEVVRWHLVNGAEAIPAADYIQSLEDEIRLLRQQAAAWRLQPRPAPGNELLEYLRTLEPSAVAELTAGADNDILEAMNTLIYRVLGASDEELRNVPSESNAIELARLLFFLCVAAYNMRTIEMRYDTEQTMLLSEEPGGGYLTA